MKTSKLVTKVCPLSTVVFMIEFGSDVSKLQTTKGLALQDIISEVHMYALKIEFPPQLRIFLLDRLAEIEFRLSSGASEKINLGSLIGAFQFIRDQAASQETELQ